MLLFLCWCSQYPHLRRPAISSKKLVVKVNYYSPISRPVQSWDYAESHNVTYMYAAKAQPLHFTYTLPGCLSSSDTAHVEQLPLTNHIEQKCLVQKDESYDIVLQNLMFI